jgi:hypothetical protein
MDSNLHRPPRRRVEPEVRAWRSHVLRQAGFRDALARQLAADGDVDLHDLLKLVDRGCPPDLAARILAPLSGS